MSPDIHLKTAGRNSLRWTSGCTTAWLFPLLLISWRKIIKILSLAFIGKEVKFECQGSKVRSSHIFLAVLAFGRRTKGEVNHIFKRLCSNYTVLCPCNTGLLVVPTQYGRLQPTHTTDYTSKNRLSPLDTQQHAKWLFYPSDVLRSKCMIPN